MVMMLKLLLIMGLMAVAAIVLNKLFPAKGGEAPRSLNDLMDQVTLDEDGSADDEPDRPGAEAADAESGPDESGNGGQQQA